ncbi:unnamed protein product [Cuscuta campestris]|uniref:Uncharacterized protein n=1 Tax=Cuscuta campestris TaxID=132261 RepID=A0A484MAV6_9ASTE|nr:unnamed protein product [Cuscuta campestris]
MDGDLLLGHFVGGRKRKRDATKQGRSMCSSSRGEDSPPREQVVIEVEDQDDVALETGTMAINPPPRSLMLGGNLAGSSQGACDTGDEARKAVEYKQRELQEVVARLTRELEEEKGRSLSSEVGSISARVARLEGEKTDLIRKLEAEKSDQVRQVEEVIESFKSSPDFAAVAMERMDELVAEWLKIEPGVQWTVKEGKKSFNCGLFRAQQIFRNKLVSRFSHCAYALEGG